MVVESMPEAARARLFVIADDPRMIDAPSLLLAPGAVCRGRGGRRLPMSVLCVMKSRS